MRAGYGLAAVLVASLTACAGGGQPSSQAARSIVPLRLESVAFGDGAAIPTRHTCDGPDLSPPLSWAGVPAGTRSLALIVDDPDAPAGAWLHWLLYDLAPSVGSLAEGVAPAPELTDPPGARQGRNDFGRSGYGGPCPPPGKAHRYVFALYALDARLDLPAGSSRRQVELAMKGHVLGEGRLIGTYGRGGR